MPRVTIYIKEDLYEKVVAAARKEGKSLSKYVGDILREHLNDERPE